MRQRVVPDSCLANDLIGEHPATAAERDVWLLNPTPRASRRIAGAALDCFENEPVITPHRLGELDNVLLAPHSIAWTDELFRDIGRTACQSILDLSQGRRPQGAVNPEVFDSDTFHLKWERSR